MEYRYRAEVLEALGRHGIRPRSDTPPLLIRDQLNDLYRYEIRRLKGDLRAGRFPLSEYIPHVLTLRGKYMLLSIPIGEWTVEVLPDP